MMRVTAVLAVRMPDVPAMVTVEVPKGAVLAAVKVTLRLVVPAEPKAAVTPLGRPEVASDTVPLKPFCPLMVMAPAPLAPGATLKLGGVAERVKPGGPITVIAIVALPMAAPAVPVTVTVDVPGAALVAALNVSVLVRVVDAGLNVAVTPAGSPVRERVTVPLNPFCGTTVMVLAPLPPWGTSSLAGDVVIV
jgi:hypothetical protein